jgi:hypothetical protein
LLQRCCQPLSDFRVPGGDVGSFFAVGLKIEKFVADQLPLFVTNGEVVFAVVANLPVRVWGSRKGLRELLE